MSQSFLLSRRFAPLFWTQFLSAFNDNFLKNTLVFLILFKLSVDAGEAMITLAGAIFIVPFLLLSALGGEIADRFDKAHIAERLKLAEIGGAVLAVAGMVMQSIPVLLAALFVFGVISALFGPIKYGILPDHLERQDLPKANAFIEAATFVAILAGTIAGGIAFAGGQSPAMFGALMIGLAVLCWLVSRSIPATGSAAPDLRIDRNILRSTWRLLGELRAERRLWVTGLAVSWFWLVGAIFLSLLPPMVKNVLGGAELAVTAYLAIFAVAIALGSAAAAWLNASRIVLLTAPVATILMAGFGLDLGVALWTAEPGTGHATLGAFFAAPISIRVAVDLAGIAAAGGLLVVPAFSAVQAWAGEERRARVVAAVNTLSAGFMAAGGAAVAILQTMGVGLAELILGLSLLNLAATVVLVRVLPGRPLRDLASILFRVFYRVEIEGLENLKKAGVNPILALNHVSLLDAPLALTLTDTEPVFAIDSGMAKRWWIRPFLKLAKAMPLDPTNPMATRSLIQAVSAGNPLIIFPEGRITVTGSLMKVYDGVGMVADKTDAQVVPVRIEGLERTIFSRLPRDGSRRRLFTRVKVTILDPVKLDIDPNLAGKQRRRAAGARLYDTMSELVFKTTLKDRTIVEAVIDAGRRHGFGSLAVEDPVTGAMSYGKLLTAASALGAKVSQRTHGEDTLGVMLPNANGAAATVLGLMSAGKVPAMINFTAGPTSILAGCRAAQVRTVLTSRAFVEQAKLGSLVDELCQHVEIVYLDDLRQTIGTIDKLRALAGRAKPLVKRRADDPAVILFTSGSEGVPKGVVLTHRNILANAAQASARIDFGVRDKVFNVLPVFHSFGLTAGLVLPLVSGVPVFLYPSPLHYRIVPELVYRSNATILFGTDTFLNGYARTAHAYDLRSIRYAFAGAEAVKASTREVFLEKFGLRILEGYGVTETAPVIAINTPMFNRSSTVGRVLPGVETRLEPVPGIAEGGRLFVRGPNVMAGYLRAENPGHLEPPEDGWHDTGDIVGFDADGFMRILGRARRFAKVGGEMVSFAAVEALASDLWPGASVAVGAVADPRKGERLVLVTDAPHAERGALQAHARANGASELMVPAEVIVAEVPLLGSGKVDYVGVDRMLAAARAA